MDLPKFRNSPSGQLVEVRAKERYWAFVPHPLPPPNFHLNNSPMVLLLSEAANNLGKLVGAGQILPNPYLLIQPYMHQEAVLSSRIEGTQASLSDLYLFEAAASGQTHPSDVLEVSNYVYALQLGLQLLDELPLSLRLVQQIHERLMRGVRGYDQEPGDFRQRQNWIGPARCKLPDATYVPPPTAQMTEALYAWETFLHAPTEMPSLIQAALMHYQFEAIHPFIDGNGRVGRLLIILFLHVKEQLPLPLLYLSAFFERHRDEYYRCLLAVSRDGDWEGWVRFFLRGVRDQASDAFIRSKQLLKLWRAYQQKVPAGHGSSSVYKLIDSLFYNPIVTAPNAMQRLGSTKPVARRALETLLDLGIVREITGRERYRVYVAEELLMLLQTEQLDSSDPPSTNDIALQTEFDFATMEQP